MKNIVMFLAVAVSFVLFTGCACKSTCQNEPAPVHHDYKGEVEGK